MRLLVRFDLGLPSGIGELGNQWKEKCAWGGRGEGWFLSSFIYTSLLLVNLKDIRKRTGMMLSIGLSSPSIHHGQTQGQIQQGCHTTSHLIVEMGRMADGKPPPCPKHKKGENKTTTALNNHAFYFRHTGVQLLL